MESIPAEIGKALLQYGPGGLFASVFLCGYVYERYARQKDKQASDARIKQLQDEQIETLKIIVPLAQKFAATMDVILPLALSKLDRRSE